MTLTNTETEINYKINAAYDKVSEAKCKSGPEVIKLFFMLNSNEHGILNTYKYKNIKKFGFFRLR